MISIIMLIASSPFFGVRLLRYSITVFFVVFP
nr:MAG TPA: hypothetical protein [Bacteriophage sp.]